MRTHLPTPCPDAITNQAASNCSAEKWFDTQRFRARTCPLCKRNPFAEATDGGAGDGGPAEPEAAPVANEAAERQDAAASEGDHCEDGAARRQEGDLLEA